MLSREMWLWLLHWHHGRGGEYTLYDWNLGCSGWRLRSCLGDWRSWCYANGRQLSCDMTQCGANDYTITVSIFVANLWDLAILGLMFFTWSRTWMQ